MSSAGSRRPGSARTSAGLVVYRIVPGSPPSAAGTADTGTAAPATATATGPPFSAAGSSASAEAPERGVVPSGGARIEVLIVHPGGPYWARRDDGAWSIPKGEVEPGEDPAICAAREFTEELGVPVPPASWVDLGEVVQAGGKHVRAWAVAGDVDVAAVRSTTFEMQWPPRSGRWQEFPEVDRAAWADLPTARMKLVTAQVALLDRLLDRLTEGPTEGLAEGLAEGLDEGLDGPSGTVAAGP